MVTRMNITVFLFGAIMGCFCIGFFVMISSLDISVKPIKSYLSSMVANGSKLHAMYKGHPLRPTVSAAELYSKVRIMCFVITNPNNIKERAVAIFKTWGKRCNKVLFVTTEPTSLVPTLVVDLPEGRDHLTGKTMQAFSYAYLNGLNDFEWFMKADDDTYTIVENLRYFLSKFSPNDPSYYGYHYNVIVRQGYYSGGSGYVLSREAVRRMVENGTKLDKCRLDGGAEDAEMGRCMEIVGVSTGDSRDYFGRERFHPFPIITHLEGSYPEWYNKNAFHGAWGGLPSCCSHLSTTFHYVTPSEMYVWDYLLYHQRVYDAMSPVTVDLNAHPPEQGRMRDKNTKSWWDFFKRIW